VTLTAKDVAEITRLLEESSFDEMELELDGLKLSFKRAGAAGASSAGGSAGSEEVARKDEPLGAEGPADTLSAPRLASAETDPTLREVVAPLLGTFYRAPKPGAAPFVEVGSQVEEESVIGIIEVMKLMTSVRAGVRGEVREIMAADGVLVEYGQALLRVRAAD